MSYTALVVKDKKGLLPKGWITQVLPPGVEPSEYERSNDSPWRVKVFNEHPIPARPKIKDKFGRDKVDYSDVHVLEGNEVKKKKHHEVWKKYDHSPGHPPPPHLKKKSTIWDYGPGRTYSSPQAALDALIAFQGVSAFTETHYIRGWSGLWDETGPVLHVHDLYPNPISGHYLIIDVEEGQSPLFKSEEVGITGPISGSYDGVAHQIIRGLNIEITGEAGAAIATSQIQWPQGALYYVSDKIVIQDCVVKHTGSNKFETVAFFLAGGLRPVVERCLALDFQHLAPTYAGVKRDWSQGLVMKSVVARSIADTFFVDPGTMQSQILFVFNCAFKCGNTSAHFLQDEDGVLFVLRLNTTFEGGEWIYYIPDKSWIGLLDIESNGNVYDYSTSFGLDKDGQFTLDQYRSFYFVNGEAFDETPTLIDWDAIAAGLEPGQIPVADESVIWTAGQTLATFDYHGFEIAREVLDIGPFQATEVPTPCPVNECGYCTGTEVKFETGVTFEELDLVDEDELDIALCAWIAEVTDIIEQYVETSWDIIAAPEGIQRACVMMTSNVVNIARQRRKAPQIRPADFDMKDVEAEVLTEEVKEILDLYKVEQATIGDGSEEGGGLGLGTLIRDDYVDE